ncbi:hypothetical protein PR048_028372 [Dryococelus australis]|uniref:Uncharacterized protein n=1 Tax=Dryococelus australis TaxID=614101 RepID=A0ABQ9GJ31_9NEOP|nr:hypothetical protein PR048_028372 [Dryococelus australis]
MKARKKVCVCTGVGPIHLSTSSCNELLHASPAAAANVSCPFVCQGLRALYVKKKGVFDQGVAARLPEAYRKFWREWKSTTPAAVHYIPEPGKWKRNPNTGVV